MRKNTPWTEAEDQLVYDHYHQQGSHWIVEQIATRFGVHRSAQSIVGRARTLGVIKSTKAHSEPEVAYVRDALYEWRAATGVDFPYQGTEEQQALYREILSVHREAARATATRRAA